MTYYCALIPAAGYGSRMQETLPKQYLDLCGFPLLRHTITTLSQHPKIEHIALILQESDQYFLPTLYRDMLGFEKVQPYYCGGKTRAQTVYNGLLAIGDQVEQDSWILVHDAARPCLSTDLINRLIETIGEHPVGGILGLPVSDTLKAVDMERQITHTVPRERLWSAQTPQMFRYSLLHEALTQNQEMTDEAAAIEALGYAPLLIQGSVYNLKVTYPEDLYLAEAILKQQAE